MKNRPPRLMANPPDRQNSPNKSPTEQLEDRLQCGIELLTSHADIQAITLSKTLLDAGHDPHLLGTDMVYPNPGKPGLSVERIVRQHRCGYQHELVLVRTAPTEE